MKPQGWKHVGPFFGAIGLAIILAGCAGQAAGPPAGDAKTPNPRDEMRMPWSAAAT